MEQKFDIVIVGGGIVGLATGYQISKQYSDLSIAVVEKEKELGEHQTGHNSGVLHSGLYYTPGSKKAILCLEGKEEMVAFAREQNIAHDICGKIIVATEEKELKNLDKIFQNGVANAVPGIEKIDAKRISEIEPHCVGIAGIWVPSSGIINYKEVCNKLAELLEKGNPKNKVFLGEECFTIMEGEKFSTIKTNKKSIQANIVVACAGLQCDRIAKKDQLDPQMKIVPFRGDYYELSEQGKKKVRNLIYPVPDPDFPFLGVHFTRMIDGSVECGPNAVFGFKREGYSRTSFSLKDTIDSLSYKGTWILFKNHWRQGIQEYKRAFSKQLFLKSLQKLIPDLTLDDIQPARAGVRAQALDAQGKMIADFKIEFKGKHVHVLNAPSPAATASLAIGRHILEEIKKKKLL
ncbi:MAG: L-2-hydroxyglutarate oxidase [Bacteroidetes bacterium]|nr:L-2-hydroxyglutarate oxidase [Bacteroidota bacterium]